MANKKPVSNSLTLPVVVAIVLVLFIGVYTSRKTSSSSPDTSSTPTPAAAFDFGNRQLILENQTISLVNGQFIKTEPAGEEQAVTITKQSLSPSSTRAAAILENSPAGSGTFYYLIGAMKKDGQNTFSEPVFLGDRITIQSVKVEDPGAENNGIITVNFLTRGANSPMAMPPTQEKTVQYAFEENGNLIEIRE